MTQREIHREKGYVRGVDDGKPAHCNVTAVKLKRVERTLARHRAFGVLRQKRREGLSLQHGRSMSQRYLVSCRIIGVVTRASRCEHRDAVMQTRNTMHIEQRRIQRVAKISVSQTQYLNNAQQNVMCDEILADSFTIQLKVST